MSKKKSNNYNITYFMFHVIISILEGCNTGFNQNENNIHNENDINRNEQISIGNPGYETLKNTIRWKDLRKFTCFIQ